MECPNTKSQLLKEIIIAIQAYFKAHNLIVKHRLWKWILLPGIIYAILFACGIYLFGESSVHVIDYFFSKTGLKTWLQKENDSWLRFIFIFGQIILQFILILFYFSWFKYLFLIVCSPLFAWLSEKTEAILHNTNYPFSMKKVCQRCYKGDTDCFTQYALANGLYYFYTVFIADTRRWLGNPGVGCFC